MRVMARPSAKAALSREKIVETTLALIEKQGLEGFSMRSLAARLKIQPMSLYHHFPSRLDLLNCVLDHVLQELDIPKPGKDWEGELRQAAREWRKLALKYPRFYPF